MYFIMRALKQVMSLLELKYLHVEMIILIPFIILSTFVSSSDHAQAGGATRPTWAWLC